MENWWILLVWSGFWPNFWGLGQPAATSRHGYGGGGGRLPNCGYVLWADGAAFGCAAPDDSDDHNGFALREKNIGRIRGAAGELP